MPIAPIPCGSGSYWFTLSVLSHHNQPITEKRFADRHSRKTHTHFYWRCSVLLGRVGCAVIRAQCLSVGLLLRRFRRNFRYLTVLKMADGDKFSVDDIISRLLEGLLRVYLYFLPLCFAACVWTSRNHRMFMITLRFCTVPDILYDWEAVFKTGTWVIM
jgi:hypothetical protein